jgi:hypothetical protein
MTRAIAILLILAARAGAAEERSEISSPPSPPPPSLPAPSAADIRASIDRGVDYLLAAQNPDGSWGSARRTKDLNIYAPVPGAHQGFRAATTSLCISALIEIGRSDPWVKRAIDRGEEWLFRELPRVRRATPDTIYNVWAHAYSIQALVRILRRHAGEAAIERRAREAIQEQIDLLRRYEAIDGGWCYYDLVAHTQKPSGTIGFVTATVLIALREAQDAGVEVPERIVRRGIDSIIRQRKPDFSYLYGEYLKWRPQRLVNRPAGSLGRSQACNFALRIWGDRAETDDVLRTWLRKLRERNLWLDIGRKRPIPHESWFQVAGYFFYYGHYYAARCLELLPAAERATYGDPIAAIIIARQEKDGSWFDYPFYDYHQPYGTAFALMTLARCLPARAF